MFAAIHATPGDSEKLLKLAQEFSPLVEQTAAGTVALAADGLERIHGLPQQIAAALARRAVERGLQASVAIASNLDTAVHAARGFAGVSVIPYGDEAKYLGSLPLTVLQPTPEMQETLERWGIRRFRDLAALPELGLAERLGPEGLRLHKLARGAGDRLLIPVAEPIHFEEEAELEYPVELLEPLMFVLAQLLNGLRARLASHGLATNELRLRLKLENRGEHTRTLCFPVPMLDTKAFLKLLDLDLGAHPPPAPVVKVWLEAEPAKPRAAQTGLFIPISPEPEKLEITLARLRSLVGEGNVGSPVLLDTHRPGAFHMLARPLAPPPPRPLARSLPLRTIRPLRTARVQMASGQPVHVQAEGVRGHVIASAGPWRTSGDWWTIDPWARDEWDVALSDGALYRIYSAQGGWFVEGSYD
jgi:protein ImuB